MDKFFDKLFLESKQEYLKKLNYNLINNVKTFVITANPEAFMIAEKNKEYEKMILDKDVDVIADGIGLVKAGRMLGYGVKQRIPGIDIANELLNMANNNCKKVYLFGAKEEVIKRMINLMKDKYKGAKLVGAKSGYVEDKDGVFKDIIKKKPDIVLVALGMPLQEELIYKYYDNFDKGIFVGVGGSFDVMSGMKKRAPKIFQKLNLEWFYRIICEPKRIKRFWNNNVKFIFKIKKIAKKK